MSIEQKIKIQLKDLILDLVNGDYKKVILDGRNGGMPESVMIQIFKEYQGTITFPPNDAFSKLDICKITDSNRYSIVFDLWVDNQPSDLSLMCNAIQEDENIKIEIEDIHVL